MRLLFQDIRYALRMLRKNPSLSAIIILSLAIGIGANTALFSVAGTLLLRPLPYPQPDRLAILWLRSPGIGIPQDWPSPGEYIDIQTQNHVFEETAIAIGNNFTLLGRPQPERIEGIRTSSGMLHLLGARPLLGRLLGPQDDKPGGAGVAVLSYGLWKRLFAADPQAIGRSLNLNGNQVTVVGVLRPEFLLNHEVMPTVNGIDKAEILLPLPLGADAVKNRGDENYNIMARVKPGVSMRQAQSDIDVIATRIR
ncbi:MAG TPA: ABC transporter permease, partial [Candidatus Solibacter sp.]|nr:ABC transporter permease [Candidatus Solibacter sp.]